MYTKASPLSLVLKSAQWLAAFEEHGARLVDLRAQLASGIALALSSYVRDLARGTGARTLAEDVFTADQAGARVQALVGQGGGAGAVLADSALLSRVAEEVRVLVDSPGTDSTGPEGEREKVQWNPSLEQMQSELTESPGEALGRNRK